MTLFAATNQPLTDEEFGRLADFLGSIGPAAMNFEALDGYFAALIAGPDMVMPSEYLPQIWGEDFSFASDGQAKDILGLLMRHWNTIAGELRRTLGEPYVIKAGTQPARARLLRDWHRGSWFETRSDGSEVVTCAGQ